MPLPKELAAKLSRSPLAGVIAPSVPEPSAVAVIVAPAPAPITPAPEPPAEVQPVRKKRRTAGRDCVICTHDHRDDIHALYADGRSPRWIADHMLKKGWSPHVRETAIKHHFHVCLADSIAHTEGADRSAKAFLESIERMRDRVEDWLNEFERGGHVCTRCREADEDDAPGQKGSRDWKAAAALVRELRGIVELHGKVLGHLTNNVEINIINHPQFTAIVNPVCNIVAACGRCGPKVRGVLEADGS